MNANGEAFHSPKQLVQGALYSGASILCLLLLVVVAMAQWLALSQQFFPKCLALYGFGFMVMFVHLSKHQPHSRFGSGNQITLARAALVALLGGFLSESLSNTLLWYVVSFSLIGTGLDAVDGWLARRQGLVSRLGARFDLEVDAFHILILALLACQSGKAGFWVLASGALRYLFVTASNFIPWLAVELPPSRRRQTICVMQVVSLTVCLLPVVSRPWSVCVAASGLALLVASFLIDICWLAHRRHRLCLRSTV